MKPLDTNLEKYVRRLIWESLKRYESIINENMDNQSPQDSASNYQGNNTKGNDEEFLRKEKEREIMNSIRELISQYFEGYGSMQSDTELMEGK